MKKIAMILLILVSMAVTMADARVTNVQQPLQSLNRVIVIVNGQPVTEHQFDLFFNRALMRFKAAGQTPPNLQQLRQLLLNQYIDRVLQLQVAKRVNITVTDKQIDQQIATLAAAQKITPAQFAANAQAEGYGQDQLREEVKTEMIIGLLQRQALSSHVTVSQNEINAGLSKLKNNPQFSSQYHVIDFLTTLKPGATPAQIAQAVHASYGADLGWRPLTALPDMFARVVPTLKVNGLSGLIKAPNGFHVLQLQGIRSAAPSGLSLKQAVAQQIYMMKMQKALQAWEATLRKQATIQMNVQS